MGIMLAMNALAQVGFDPEDLIYLVFIVLAVLGGLGKQIRDKYRDSKGAPTKAPSPPPPTPDRGKAAGLPRSTGRLDPSQAEVILAELFDLPTARRRRPGSRPERTGQPVAPTPPPVRPGETRRRAPAQEGRAGGARPPARRPKGSAPARPTLPPQASPVRPRPSQPPPGRKPEAAKAHAEYSVAEPMAGVAAEAKPGLSVGELRRAIIMNEILAPPVALRGQSHSF